MMLDKRRIGVDIACSLTLQASGGQIERLRPFLLFAASLEGVVLSLGLT